VTYHVKPGRDLFFVFASHELEEVEVLVEDFVVELPEL